MAHPTLATRTVESVDPSLSGEANRLLTQELRAVIGRDHVEIPVGRPHLEAARHATHSKPIASLISVRAELQLVGLVAAMAVLIALAISLDNPWLLGIAYLLMIPNLVLVPWTVMRLFRDPEHLDPDVAAQLSAEGVGDPDHVFNQLVREFKGAALPRR